MERLNRKKNFIIAAIFLCISTLSFAQHEGVKHHSTHMIKSKKLNALNFIKVTFGLGLSTYYGDICEGWDCYQFRQSISMGAYYRYNKRFSFKGDFFYTRLFNDDQIYKLDRNLGFRTDVFELSASVMYDLFPFQHKFDQRRTVEPYIQLGLAAAYFNPMGKLDGKWYNLHQYQTEGVNYSRLIPVIPFGLGLRTRLRHDLNLAGEFIYRLTFTDYLDDVSGPGYKNPNSFPNGGANSLAAQLSNRSDIPYFTERIRGNDSKNDGYFTFNLRIEYMIKAYTDQASKGNINKSPTGGRKTIKRR